MGVHAHGHGCDGDMSAVRAGLVTIGGQRAGDGGPCDLGPARKTHLIFVAGLQVLGIVAGAGPRVEKGRLAGARLLIARARWHRVSTWRRRRQSPEQLLVLEVLLLLVAPKVLCGDGEQLWVGAEGLRGLS
jgi:hypothetical protein